MNPVEIIVKKRDGLPLTGAEIDYFVQGFTRGDIPDYQLAAFAMAVYFQGMTPQETTDLTLAMADSGMQLPVSGSQRSPDMTVSPTLSPFGASMYRFSPST